MEGRQAGKHTRRPVKPVVIDLTQDGHKDEADDGGVDDTGEYDEYVIKTKPFVEDAREDDDVVKTKRLMEDPGRVKEVVKTKCLRYVKLSCVVGLHLSDTRSTERRWSGAHDQQLK